ncbi:dehydrodolichyl diphosphate synthase complex subunit Nus1 isoform X1 [Vespula squamosa]|uniref:ditrans,polycis-polyprenyl diphosphate synthase [(2E,6E)-farnesyldiphosphate specific] n=1 Tax=Vespula squamosa TaxID=30214 RepID=A0ABD2B1Q9_VESSQ
MTVQLKKHKMFIIFRTLLILIHLLYSLRLIIYNSCLIVHRKCIGYWYKKNPKIEIEMLVHSMNKLRKLPEHVVILGEKKDCIKDSIQIISWCITLGIPFISFYGRKDFLSQHENALKQEFAVRRPELMEYVNWSQLHIPRKENGIKGSNTVIRILLPCKNSGKGGVVLLTQHLAEAVITKNLKIEEVNENFICEKMTLKGIPDPDLALIHGHICSTYGFLPWHIRTTGFVTLPKCHNVSVKDFIWILKKYSKREQRYGE